MKPDEKPDLMSAEKRDELVEFFQTLQDEAARVVQQLKNGRECVYTRSSHLASACGAVGMEWSVGPDPSTGEKMFKLYLPKWAKG